MSEIAQILVSMVLTILWCVSLAVLALYVWGTIRQEQRKQDAIAKRKRRPMALESRRNPLCKHCRGPGRLRRHDRCIWCDRTAE